MRRILTKRQLKITKLVADGLKNAEIGKCVGRTEHMIKNYIVDILDVTGMNSRLELALWYLQHASDNESK